MHSGVENLLRQSKLDEQYKERVSRGGKEEIVSNEFLSKEIIEVRRNLSVSGFLFLEHLFL